MRRCRSREIPKHRTPLKKTVQRVRYFASRCCGCIGNGRDSRSNVYRHPAQQTPRPPTTTPPPSSPDRPLTPQRYPLSQCRSHAPCTVLHTHTHTHTVVVFFSTPESLAHPLPSIYFSLCRPRLSGGVTLSQFGLVQKERENDRAQRGERAALLLIYYSTRPEFWVPRQPLSTLAGDVTRATAYVLFLFCFYPTIPLCCGRRRRRRFARYDHQNTRHAFVTPMCIASINVSLYA